MRIVRSIQLFVVVAAVALLLPGLGEVAEASGIRGLKRPRAPAPPPRPMQRPATMAGGQAYAGVQVLGSAPLVQPGQPIQFVSSQTPTVQVGTPAEQVVVNPNSGAGGRSPIPTLPPQAVAQALNDAVAALTPRVAAQVASNPSVVGSMAAEIVSKLQNSKLFKPVQKALATIRRVEQQQEKSAVAAVSQGLQNLPLEEPAAGLEAPRKAITSLGNPQVGVYQVAARPGVTILNEDGSVPAGQGACGCQNQSPCDNPCQRARSVSDEIEDRLDEVKNKIVLNAQKIQQNNQWTKEVRKVIEHYNTKLKAVDEDTVKVKAEVTKLFAAKKRFEDLLLQQTLDADAFNKVLQTQKDLGLTCKSPPSTC